MSSVKDGHFTVTPELERAALLCFASFAIYALGEEKLRNVLEDVKDADERFRVVVIHLLADVVRQMEEIAKDERGG